MVQTWRDVLFAHWDVDPDYLRRLVPEQLTLDTYDGRCWVAVTPLVMTDVHPRFIPPLAGMSRFPELNVRTYVTMNGKPGVFFFSLDAANIPAVMGARAAYGLPYFYARMMADRVGYEVNYYCHRTDVDSARPEFHGNASPDADMIREEGVFRARYWPTSQPSRSLPGTLEYFLTERYCLYSVVRGRVYRADIHHLPWPLQRADAIIDTNTMARADSIELPERKPLLHFARNLTVLVWWPERVQTAA